MRHNKFDKFSEKHIKNQQIITGTIKPNKPVTVNWKRIKQILMVTLKIKIPRNQKSISFTFNDKIIVKKLTNENNGTKNYLNTIKKPKFQPYSDLKNHWIEKIANQLKKKKN